MARREVQAKYRRTLKGRYSELKKCAKKRELPLSLSFQEYCSIAQAPCFYCGQEFSLKVGGYWLDRKDNRKAYSRSNVIPACWPCNDMRGDRLTVQEMVFVWEALKGFRRALKTQQK